MFKSIPKSSVSKRNFKTFKRWNVGNSSYPVISASFDSSSNFDSSTELSFDVNGTTIYNRPYYNSLKAKYYQSNGNVITQFGVMENPANFQIERRLPNTFYVISIDRDKFGEQIKQNSLILEDLDNNTTYNDDGYGSLIKETYDYYLLNLDLGQGTVTVYDGFNTFTLDVITIDMLNNEATLLYSGQTIETFPVEFDFGEGIVRFSEQIPAVGDLFLENVRYGNVFYDDGLVVLTNEVQFENYNLIFNSTHTIYETEVLINVDEGEFNYSQNPSAVIVELSGSYQFETTPITNVSPAQNVTIKHINQIKLKQSFSGSYNPNITGSWDDYSLNRWSDPTGSYLTPYITTIGLYDDDGDLVVVAKLPQPIKSYPDLPVNFLVRFDS
jgi:hypothetical protein